MLHKSKTTSKMSRDTTYVLKMEVVHESVTSIKNVVNVNMHNQKHTKCIFPELNQYDRVMY